MMRLDLSDIVNYYSMMRLDSSGIANHYSMMRLNLSGIANHYSMMRLNLSDIFESVLLQFRDSTCVLAAVSDAPLSEALQSTRPIDDSLIKELQIYDFLPNGQESWHLFQL